ALRRNLDVQLLWNDLPGDLVLEPRQQPAQDAEARRDDAGRIARVHAFVEHLHAQVAAGHAAQRRGQPELVVVAAAGIEADDERRLADARGQMIDVVRQVVAAGFFARLDHDHAARVRRPLLLQRENRGERAEQRVAVVGGAATVQAVALDDRLPRTEVRGPA